MVVSGIAAIRLSALKRFRGVILIREADGDFKTPAADNPVYRNFPAIVFGFPMMLSASLAPKQPLLTFIFLVAFFIVMNVILFRSFISSVERNDRKRKGLSQSDAEVVILPSSAYEGTPEGKSAAKNTYKN